ncbi:transport and Golgi organization protein 1 homolog, partial [Acinonyx jubatus]|uniref:Transport and Golgi organization protein 1 homolog n=1 Tax=Acinonyx jubatus TaxID=32536 RepID=A0ABM3PE10_ACIJB
ANVEFEDVELRDLRSNNYQLEGIFSVGEKSPYDGNDLALVRERILSCLHDSCPFSVSPKSRLRSCARLSRKHLFFFPENKKALEDKCNALRSVKNTKETKVKQLKEKAHNLEEFYEQRKVPTKKEAENDTVNWQQRRISWQLQIAVHEKNAQDNEIKTQIWDREMVEQGRDVAYLKYRLDRMEAKRLPEGYTRQKPMAARPEMQNLPRRGQSGSWRPPPLTGRFCMPYPRNAPPPWTIRHIHLLNLGGPGATQNPSTCNTWRLLWRRNGAVCRKADIALQQKCPVHSPRAGICEA